MEDFERQANDQMTAQEAARQAAAFAEQAAREAAQAEAELEELLAARAALAQEAPAEMMRDEAPLSGEQALAAAADALEAFAGQAVVVEPAVAAEPSEVVAAELKAAAVPVGAAPATVPIAAAASVEAAPVVAGPAPAAQEAPAPVVAGPALSTETPVQAAAPPASGAAESAPAVAEPASSAASPASDAAAPAPGAAESAPAAEEPAAKPAKKKAKPLILAIAAVIIVAGIGVAVYFTGLSSAYEKANELYAAGQYAEAAEEYQKLGDYENSAERYEKALRWMAAIELERNAGEDPDAWLAAAEAFKQITDIDAAVEASICEDNATYYTSVALMQQGRWTEAVEGFRSLDRDFKNTRALQAECQGHVALDEAEELYAQGRYYEAYLRFQDAAMASQETEPTATARMQDCIQPRPDNGVIWRSGSYPNDTCELTIVNSADEDVYYKLYLGNDLAITVYIRADSSATFMLQAGTYRMNKAYGDQWFGPEDMFGDDGTYYTCSFGGSDTAELEYGNGYEISAGSGGTGIGTHSASRESI